MNATSNFLWQAAKLLPTENRAQILLKSYYLTKIRKESNVIDLKAFSDEELCRKCSTPWTDTRYSMGIKPIKKSKRESQKIRSKIDDKSDLKKQKYAKKSAKNVNNLMVIKCNVCNSKKNVILWKQTGSSEKVSTEISSLASAPSAVLKTTETNTKAKKRKRNKDKTAGLLLPTAMHKKLENKTIVTTHQLNNQQTTKDVQQCKNQREQRQHLTLNPNKPKSKLSAKKPALKLMAPVAPKKNSLLHLANALKRKSSSTTANNNKLQKMLR